MDNARIASDPAWCIGERIIAVRRLVQRALALRPMNCLAGQWPPGMAVTMLHTDDRFRRYRSEPVVNRHIATDRISTFWCRDHVRGCLLREIMLQSLAEDAALRLIRVPELAHRTGLSVGAVQYTIKLSIETGDFIKVRSSYDKRTNVLIPSAELYAYFIQDIRDNLRGFSDFCGRPRLDPDILAKVGGSSYARLMIRSMSMLQDGLSENAAALARRNFFYLMWDLLLEPELGGRGCVATMARRLQISAPTVAKVVEQGREHGWFEPGEYLVPSALARQRYAMMLSVFEARCNLLLDALDAVLAEPGLAPALDPLLL